MRPQEDSGGIVPFGKYRGQPVEVMMADQSYLDWMLGQPGMVAMIQGKYPALFNIITIGAPTSDDSPDHNKLQARFLNPEFQLAFLEARLGQSIYAIAVKLAANAAANAATMLAEALPIAKQDDIQSTEALQEIQKVDIEIKGADWKEHYDKERKEYLEKQREEENRIREKKATRSRDPWSHNLHNLEPVRVYSEPFPGYEQWLETDYSSWPAKVKRHTKQMESVVARQLKDRQMHQTITNIHIRTPEPAKPVVSVLEFECGFDVRIHFAWSATVDGLWVYKSESANYYYHLGCPTKWVETSSKDHRTDKFKIEIKPQMGDDFPSVLRQMKRNGADTLVVEAFESAVCTLDQVRQIFGEKRILTFAEIEAIQKRGIWPRIN